MDLKQLKTESEIFETLASQIAEGLLNVGGLFIGGYCDSQVVEKFIVFGHCVGGSYLRNLIHYVVISRFDLAELNKIVERAKVKAYGTADVLTEERLPEAIAACGEVIALFHQLRQHQSKIDQGSVVELINNGSKLLEAARKYPALKPLLDDSICLREENKLLEMTKISDFSNPRAMAVLAETMVRHLREFGPAAMDKLVEVMEPSLFRSFWEVCLATARIPLFTNLVQQKADIEYATGKIGRREYELRLVVVALGHALEDGQSARTFRLAYAALVDGTRSLFDAIS